MHKLIFSLFKNQSFIDLGLYQFGRETCESGHMFGPARRQHYLFHYVISGEGKLLSNDSNGHTNTFNIKSGEGFLIFPGQVNTYIADLKNPWEYTWLEFDGLRVKQALESAGFSMRQPVYKTKSEELREKMKNEILEIVHNSESSQFNLIGHLYLFMDYLTGSAANAIKFESSNLRDFYIREAVAYIENNFHREISVEDIASVLRLNRSYFGKIFKAATGKTPQSFLMNYRMVKAAEMLKLTQLSVSEIGEAVGYPNQMHFSRAFKKIYSVSPRGWRSKN